MNAIDNLRLLRSALALLAGAIIVLPDRAVAQTNLPGMVDETFNPLPGPNANVRATAFCPDGRIIIAGEVNAPDPFLRGGVAKLNIDGTLEPNFDVGLGANANIWTVAVQTNGKVLVAGDFTVFNGTNRSRIARLNSDGSVDSSFNPGLGADAGVWSLALQNDGRILIGGDFLTVNGISRPRVARLNSNGSLDTSFDPGLGADAMVRALALQGDGRVIVAGGFNAVGGITRPRIARLNDNGSVDASFGAGGGASDWIVALAVQADNRVIVGGYFTSFAGIPRTRVARLTADGSVDETFDPGLGPNEAVTTIALQMDGKVVLGGGFSAVDGYRRYRFARLHSTGRVDGILEADPGANNWVETVAIQSDGKILIGGSFASVNGQPRQRVARLFGGDPAPFAPVIVSVPVNSSVIEGSDVSFHVVARAFPEASYQWQFRGVDLPGSTRETLTVRNVRLANAGLYTVVVSNEVGAVSRSAMLSIIAAPTHAGAADIDFYTGLGPTNVVSAIALHAGRIVTGGGVWQPGGLLGRVMRLENNGAPDPTFANAPFAQGLVETVGVEPDGDIVTGGAALTGVRRLLSNGSIDHAFNTAGNPADSIHSLAIQGDGRIVGAGENGGEVMLRRFETNGPVDLTFLSLQPVLGAVYALARQTDGRWLIGGQFDTVMGVARNGVARINSNGGLDLSFDPGSGANSRVLAVIQQPDGRLVLAGQFTRINGVLRNRVARLLPNGALDPSFDPGPGADNNIMAVAWQPDGRILIGGIFENVNGVPRGGIARLHADGSLDFTFDTSIGADGPVRAIVPLPNGQVLVGGSFQRINDVPRPGIARLRGGGPTMVAPAIVAGPTNQTVNSGTDAAFIVVASGSPLVRYQWQVNGVNIPGATSWILTLANARTTNSGAYTVLVSNPFGTVTSTQATLTVTPAPRHPGAPDINFSTGSGPNDRVHAIALEPSGKIFIGGAFTHVNGLRRGGIARLERSGAVDTSFDPGSGANGTVYAIARQADGALVLGGTFTTMNGNPRFGLARLDSAGVLDANFTASAGPGAVFAVALQNDGKVLVGGAFSFVASSARPAIARLETNGSLDFAFTSPFLNGAGVYAIDFQRDGRAIVAGYLPSSDGLSQNRLARLQPDGTRDGGFASALASAGPVYTLSVLNDDRVLFGGNFIAFNSSEFNRIARVHTNGAPDLTFHPGSGANNVVRTVALQTNGMAAIGGAFEIVNGQTLPRLARLREDGSVDLMFNVGSGFTEGTFFFDEYGDFIDLTTVNAIAVEDNGGLLVGGDFTKVNGITRPYLARVYDRAAIPIVRVRNLTGSMVELAWEFGVLQHAVEFDGPWRDVVPASSPMQLMRTGSQRFFRLRVDD